MKMLKITLEGKTYEVGVEVIDGSSAPVVAPIAAPVAPVVSSAAPVATGEALTAPMSGILLKVSVKVGDVVKSGQEVAVLEAMKMETSLAAPVSGTVTSTPVAQGASVTEGQVLVTIG